MQKPTSERQLNWDKAASRWEALIPTPTRNTCLNLTATRKIVVLAVPVASFQAPTSSQGVSHQHGLTRVRSCLTGRCTCRSPADNPIQSDLFILSEKHLKACTVLTYVFLCLSHTVPIFVFCWPKSSIQKSRAISSATSSPDPQRF